MIPSHQKQNQKTQKNRVFSSRKVDPDVWGRQGVTCCYVFMYYFGAIDLILVVLQVTGPFRPQYFHKRRPWTLSEEFSRAHTVFQQCTKSDPGVYQFWRNNERPSRLQVQVQGRPQSPRNRTYRERNSRRTIMLGSEGMGSGSSNSRECEEEGRGWPIQDFDTVDLQIGRKCKFLSG